MGIRRMQGTSAHIEYIGPRGKKYRKNCIYYHENICVCKKSQAFMVKCIGRLYCGQYDDDNSKKEEIKKYIEELIEECKVISEKQKIEKEKYRNLDKRNKKKEKNREEYISKNTISLDNKKNYLLGKTIKLRSLKMQEDIVIKIVKANEVSTINRKYSIDSNFARSLAGKSVGDVIRVNVVKGYLAFKILSIE